jgi:copper chaperone CopZ
VLIGTTPFASNSTITVTKVDADGIAIVNIKAKLPNVPGAALIDTKFKDATGNLNYDMKVKMTDEGLLDYTNIDHKPFVLVKYDAEVGDKYTLDLSNGTTITRQVVSKSTTDDYSWGGMKIKTINIEQSSTVSGIKKIEYITNHKFSIVGVKFYMEDGTFLKIDLSSLKF